jgi:hypothetical protein
MTGIIGVVSRESIGDWEVIAGFGHAIYGAITPDGDIATLIGWWQSSRTTRTQLAVLRSICDTEYSGRPGLEKGTVVVTTKSSDVPDVLPPSLYDFENDSVAAERGVAFA